MIYKKLLEFKKLNIVLKKDGNNPFHKSKYSTLNEVLDKINKPLNDMNILIIQLPEKEGLKTILLDIDDDTKIEGFMPYVEATTAQKLGANNTYNRRYSLVTMLGLEDNDDDGNKASNIGKPIKKSISMSKDNAYKMTLEHINSCIDKKELNQIKIKLVADKKIFTQEQKINLLKKANEKLGITK